MGESSTSSQCQPAVEGALNRLQHHGRQALLAQAGGGRIDRAQVIGQRRFGALAHDAALRMRHFEAFGAEAHLAEAAQAIADRELAALAGIEIEKPQD